MSAHDCPRCGSNPHTDYCDAAEREAVAELVEAVRGVGIAGKGPGVASRREWARVQSAVAALDSVVGPVGENLEQVCRVIVFDGTECGIARDRHTQDDTYRFTHEFSALPQPVAPLQTVDEARANLGRLEASPANAVWNAAVDALIAAVRAEARA